MKEAIEAMRLQLLESVSEIGQMVVNLNEALDWLNDSPTNIAKDNALCSLESVSAGADEAFGHLHAISLKCEELCAAKGVVSQ